MLKCGIRKAGWAPGGSGIRGGSRGAQRAAEWGGDKAGRASRRCLGKGACMFRSLSLLQTSKSVPVRPGVRGYPIAVVPLEGHTQPACESGCWASGSHEGAPRPELPAHSDPEAALFTEDAALHSDPRRALAAAATRTACCAVLCSLAKKMRPSGDWWTRVGTGSKALPPPPPRSLCLSQAPAYASQLLRTNLLYQAVQCALCHLVH